MWFSGVNERKNQNGLNWFEVSLSSNQANRCEKQKFGSLLKEGGDKLLERAHFLNNLKALNYCWM